MPEELKPVNLPGRPRNIVPLDNSGPAQLTGSVAYRQSKETLESLFASVPINTGAKQSTRYQSEVDDLLTGRYNNVIYGANNEDIHGRNQSTLDKAVNGTLKGVGLAATTFVGGLGTLYGVGKSFYTGKLSDIWQNEISETLDVINKEVDNKYLPNYYADKESNAAWYSSDNLLTANFLFDKLIKNAGFAVGAIYSGNLAAKGIGVVGGALGGMFDKVGKYTEAWKTFSNINKGAARLFSQGKNIEAAEILKKSISTVADAEKASAEMLKISNQFLNIAGVQDFTRRSIMSVYSAAGESSFESYGTASSFRERKIQEFRDKWGFDPGQEEMDKINELSKQVGNVSFMANMAVLSATEFTQLPYLMGSSYKTGKATANAFRTAGEVVETGGKYTAKATTRLSKTKSFITSYIFDPKESLQEYLQASIDVGVQDYYNKAYEGTEAKDLTEAFINAGTAGWEALKSTLTSKEGGESILLGGLSGGLMQARGKSRERKYKSENTNSFLQELNVPESTFTDAFNDRLKSFQRGIVLQQKGERALEDGDKLEFLDNRYDSIHNYLSSRIKYGRTDMVLDDIAERRKQSSSEEGYKNLQAIGGAPMNLSREDYVKKLNEFESHTKALTSLYASTNLAYQGKVDADNKRTYSDVVIDKMVYAASKITDYDRRIPQLNLSLSEFGISAQDVLQGIIKENKPNKQATVDILNQINELDVINETKDELKSSLADIIELGTRRKLFIEQHNDIVENPSRYQSAQEFEFGETKEVPVTVAQDSEEKPTKKLQIGKEYSLAEPFRKEGAQLQLAPKITVLSQTLGGELEVRLPNGKTSFMTPEEFEKYTISDKNNTSQEIADIVDKAIDTVLKNGKHDEINAELKEVVKQLEDKKLDKLGWVNSLENQDLIDDIEEEFNRVTKELFEKRNRQAREAEQLKRNKEEITKQQGEIVNNSGTVGTNDPNKDKVSPEGKIPPASILFISGTSMSEAEGVYVDENGETLDPKQAAIHIRNQREFLNNVGGMANRKNMRAILITSKLAKAYGLDGLIELSYNESLDKIADLNDVDNGFIAQVFVEQVGDRLFFVDKNGNQIGEVGKQVENVSDVIFQTMRTTNINYNIKDSKGNPIPRYRKGQKEEAEAYAAAWKIQRAKIFNIDPNESPTPFAFQVSRGIAKMGDVDNHISGVLIDEKTEAQTLATDQTLIQIPTAGVVAHHTGQINVPNGRPMLVHNDNVEFLNNRKFTKKQAEGIYEAIKQIATEINEQSNAGKRIIINKKLSRFLQNVLYWRLGKTEAESNQINISEDGSSISLSGNTYSIPEIAERRDDIIETLEKAFHNVNNDSLAPENFSKPFTEYYMKDGVLVSNEWTNYQTYLLSSKYPNGSARPVTDTPLSTKITKPTDAVPTTHEQKYSTLVGLELPVGVIAKPAPAAATPTAPSTQTKRKYDYDGDTDNIFTTPFGDVIFTVKEGEDPKFDQEDASFKATRDKIIKKLNDNRIKKGEQALPEEELIPTANGFIIAYVKKELETDVVVAPAPPVVVVPPVAPIVTPAPASTSNVETTYPSQALIVKQYSKDDNILLEGEDYENQLERIEKTIASGVKKGLTREQIFQMLSANGHVFNLGSDAITVNNFIQNRIDGKETRPFKDFVKNTRNITSSTTAPVSTVTSEVEKKLRETAIALDDAGIEKVLSIPIENIIKHVKERAANNPNTIVGSLVMDYANRLMAELRAINIPVGDKTKLIEIVKVIDKLAPTNNLGFQNLGNIGNQGLAVMEADILKTGRSIISGISKATPEQRNKIDENIEELKKKYPEKTFVVQTLGDNLTIDVATTPVTTDVNISPYGVIAADYLFTGGPGVILSTDYFIQALSGAFTNAGGLIEQIRQKYVNAVGDLGNLKDAISTENYAKMIAEIRSAIESTYNNQEVNDIFNVVLNNATGFPSRLGNEVSAKLETLNAELAAAPKEPGSFNPNNIKKRGNLGFRKVGKDRTDRMTEADLKAFKEWHAKYVPFIPFEVLENMINLHNGEKAWGVFENGVAKFVKGGLRGTEYHEVGEAIWNGMLTKEERAALIAEFRNKTGQFTDRETGKKYNHDDPTVSDDMVKERILDDFSDFRVGKLPARTLGEKITKFFRRIFDFVKSFIAKPSLKTELFKAIESGKFKDRQLSTESKSMPPQYRGAGHLTEEQTNAYVKDMTILASSIILGNGDIGTIDKSALYNLRTLTSDDVFSKIEEIYAKLNVRQELGDIAWKDLVVRTKQELKVLLKIDFNEEDLVNINEGETNKNDYVKEPFSTDYKKTAPIGIKFVSATLPEAEPTNQENSNSFELPELKVNPKTQTYSLVGYTRVFATMLDALKNTTSIKKVISKIVNLANQDSNYVRMFKTLGGNLNTKTIDFTNFKFEDWRLFIEMMQTYTKQKPDAIIQYISQGQVYSGSALVTGIVNKTVNSWVSNLKGLSKEEDSVIKWDSVDKSYSVTDLSGIPSGTPEEKEKFLAKLGIIFPLEAWAKLKEPQQKEFTIAVASIKEYLQKAKEIKSIQKNTLDVGGHYDTLATLLVNVTHPNQESTRINIDGKQSNSFTDNNVPSVFENEFNEVATLDELLAIRPELKDLYSRGALLLKKGGQFFDKEGKRTKLELKVGYIEGTKNKDKNKGTSSTALTEGDRYTQEINQNLIGQYYIMIPADGSTEWMMNMGNHVAFEDIEQGRDGWKKINEIFRGYLTDDVALALDADNRIQVENVGGLRKIADIESKLETLKAVTNKSDAQKEEVKKLNAQLEYLKKKPYELRFFKDILSEKTLAKINQMIEENATQQDIESFIDDNIEDVNASIKEYIDGTVAKTKDFLLQNNQVRFVTRDAATGIDYYRYDMLNGKFAMTEKLNKSKLTIDDLTNIITFANANYIINNIEFHKIIFGDPYQFAIKEDGTLDATKRFKSFFSPRRTTIDSPELNTFINEDLNNAGDIQLLPGEPGYHQAKAWMDTVTVSDVNIVGSVTNMKNVPEDVKKAFAKTNEGDAASIMMDGTYREMKIKNGQWNINGVEEAWHQWQMAYTRQNLPGFKYSDDARGKALEKHDIALLKTKQPDHKIEIVKPIVSGVTNGVNRINLVLDKFSQMPLYYSMVQGTNLEKLYLKMMAEKKGYIIMISGRKVGAEALHDLYNKNGQFNDSAFNNNIEVPWKAYGIQVETAYEGSGMQTRGSQLTKLSTLDLYENGKSIGATPERREEIAKEVARNRDILNRLHKNGYERFLKRLGIEDLGGSYKIKDKTRLAKTLKDEMFRRELSDNVKDSIQLDENKEFIIPFEASPAYLQIKSILYSFIDKEITSPKMNGGSYVQAPVTLWENAKAGRKIAIKTADGYKQITRQEFDGLSPEEQKKVVLTDDTLKFYEDENGKRYCEVMLPHWFKSKLGKHASKSDEELIKFLNTTAEGKELLSGIGFRIPTQSLSSVEAFKVKAFLPKYMGKTVIVPSEITTKSGSDFDIDKLNMYLKSIYVDKFGEIRIIKLKGSEENTKDFYAKVFDEKLELQKINKAELFDAATIMVEGLDDPKNLGDRYADAIDILFAEAYTLEDRRDVLDDFIKKLEKLGDKDAQALLKEKFIEDSYRRALENEYYDSLEKLVTMPENFQRLISPVSDDGLKELSNVLDELRGYDENKIKNRLLDRNYMTSLRHAFVTAKKWVGIAAVNITGHSLTQKFKAYIDPARFNNVSKEDRDILRYNGGEMLLDHNTIEDNGKSYISLSGRLDTDGKFISDGLSGYATSFVDVAKDPYILKIIKNNLAVGTFMFLRRTGVPSRQLVMFMNQPIINEYLTMLDNKGIKTLFDTRQISAIKNKFPSRVAETASTLGFNKGELEANIKNYYATKDLGDAKNREQVAIFNEFLKYAKMAEYSFNFGQASNYDTTKFQSGDSLQLKQWRTEAAQKKNIISSVGNLLQNNFIGVQAEYLDMSMDALGEALVLETPQFTDVTNEVLKSFEQDRFLTKDKFDRIANKIKAAFLDYIIQKRSDIATNLQEQLVDDRKSVAQMLLKAKQEFPGVQILEDLEVDSSGRIGGAQTIKLKVNDKIAYNENMYAGMMRELRDDPRTNALYKGIVRLAIIQGTYQSSISIKNIIPVEDYSAHITPILAGLTVDDEIRAFATSNEFQRNEWQDNDVVPIIEPTFEALGQTDTDMLNDIPRTFQGRFKTLTVINGQAITAPGFFPVVKELGANLKKQRDLLFISAKYQGKVANYDVIKVPRTVPINKEDVTEGRIDVSTGEEITARDYAKMAEKGDLSLRNYYGYQKVKYADGSPVIARYDKDGNPTYVYKFINLHGDGQYATEYYGDGRPSIFNNGSEKNVKNIDGTLVSNEIPDQVIIDFYGGETVTQDLADPIIATIEKESESGNMKKPVPGVENIPNSGLTVEQSNQFIDLLQPQIGNQAYVENRASTANMMFSFGLRWARNVPNEGEKSEQGKNLGKPRPNRKQINSKEGMTYGYYLTDQNNNPLPSIKELQPIMDFIQSKLGIDMSNYDAMLGNIYDNNSFISQHRDTTESVSAKNYPVVVINLGANGILEFDRDTSSNYATYKKSGELNLTNGGIYAFGINGESRFTFHHRIESGLKSATPLKPIMLPNGQMLDNYRITLTFRRASDLEPGMPTSPNRVSKENVVSSQPTSINVKPGVEELFDSNPELASIGTAEQYSAYLDSIFPDSQVKNIVYHGSPNAENIKKEGFVNRQERDKGYIGEGYYFTQYNDWKAYTGDITGVSDDQLKKLNVVLNIKNPQLINNETDRINLLSESNVDGRVLLFDYDQDLTIEDAIKEGKVRFNLPLNQFNEIVVFKPEQIHILGNKQDVEGFKKFVNKSQPTQPVSSEIKIEDEGSIVYDPETERVGMTVGSDKEGYLNVEFDGDDEVYTFKRDALELSDAFNLRDASEFNTIELEIGNIITVDNSNLRLLSVDETDYYDVKFLKFQSKSGLIVPAIIEYDERTGKSEIIPNPEAWQLGLEDNEYNTDDFKC